MNRTKNEEQIKYAIRQRAMKDNIFVIVKSAVFQCFANNNGLYYLLPTNHLKKCPFLRIPTDITVISLIPFVF